MKKVYARELNVEVRKAFKTAGVPRYAVANYLGIKPGYFYQCLMSELTPDRKEQVLNALRAIYRNEYAGSDRGSTVPEHS